MLDALIAWHPGECDEEELVFVVVETLQDQDDYVLTINGRDTWSDKTSRWRLRAHVVREMHFRFRYGISQIECASEHPLLLPHTAPRTELFVRNAPEDASRFLGDLWRTHDRVAKSWVTPYFRSDGPRALGQLAKGPRPLLEAYREVAATHGMQPTLVGDYGPDHANPLHVLLLGESWIIAERFSCERLDDPGT